MLDAAQFHPGRTGRNHLRVFAKAADVQATRVDALLDQVGLGPAAHARRGPVDRLHGRTGHGRHHGHQAA